MSNPYRSEGIRPYIEIARIDHWFKNAFMLLGVALAFFYRQDLLTWSAVGRLVVAVSLTCIVASSNYVLNEYLDADMDREHPTKFRRPAARGAILGQWAILEWGLLGLIGFGCSFFLGLGFGLSALALWIMGCLYNIPPIRLKELPYLDVLSESLNNPIRLFLGWFALVPEHLPPLSLAMGYWMMGAYFMAAKRYAEYRSIGDPERAARYRRSFRHYNLTNLMASIVFYLTMGGILGGIFIVRYKIELILTTPLIAGFFSWYMSLTLEEDSPVQAPEKLYRRKGFFLYALFCTVIFLGMMFVEIPSLNPLFRVDSVGFPALWRFGG
ncbi:MAG: UbiA family prenyltransferase [Planctomycetes bacterium]|nr:UbiA family prenyltransferase [Planctomycetota bacterium]MCB9911258.1 UbiA family prenyltransferase [Planctomycetota bacterium]HPF13744.1 UbiA family prenyltransferase [Planctomycetota bacterium]HRV81013.1 UbiA family prenyltransferase [Planctomycetota bacterium]